MIKHMKIRQVNQNTYVIYWNKAEEFYETMQQAYKQRMWTAIGLNAVHCAISSCDALLVRSQGIRAAGENHMQAIDLLAKAPVEGIQKQVAAIRRIIAKKNVIAYENREFRQSDASDILKQAKRFYRWTFDYLNKK